MLFDKWQTDVLNSKGNIVVRSGRQCGKSTTIAALAARYATKNPKKQVLIIASVERQAYLLFEKVVAYVNTNHANLLKKGRQYQTKSKLVLKNGSIIHCLPTGLTGYGIRGYTIDLLIADEAAFIPREVWDAVTPMIATRIKHGARMVLLSTPFGRDNYFYDCFDDDSFSKFHVSSEQCDRIDKKFLAREKERMSEVAYAQEYLGEFADGLMQWFPDELIKKCMQLKRPEQHIKGNYYLGSDIARMGEDLTTFEIVDLVGDKLYHIENIITRKQYLNQTTDYIIHLDKKYNFKKIFIDNEGVGIGVYDWLRADEQTKRKTIGVKNSQELKDGKDIRRKVLQKEELYVWLLSLMRKDKIYLLDDPEIYFSLRSVQYEYTTDTQGRAHLHIFGKDTHIAEGLIRAALALKHKSLNTWFRSFKV